MEDLVRLAPHPISRNAALTKVAVRPGSVVAAVPALATSLLPPEKGRRCDGCHVLGSESVTLKRCSGCASFWYCGTTSCKPGQNRDWKLHHKKICKHYNTFVVSGRYQALTTHDKVDALLLSQLVAEPDVWRASPEHSSDAISTFLDLIKVTRSDGFVPPLCLSKGAQTTDAVTLAENLYARFGNNNFVLHSHLNSYAHGVFPRASRYFNHSCVPNAACKYVITPSEPVRMEVVVLRDINEGEEVTIPYLDPALPFQTRQDALRANYRFECGCSLCAFGRRVEPVPSPPAGGSAELRALESALRSFSLGDINQGQGVQVPTAPGAFETLPRELHSVLHESYLPSLSEAFSKASHEGPYDDAVESGLTLLAFYAMIYPPSYPQIGKYSEFLSMHTLELAKTLWNIICTDVGAVAGADDEQLKAHARAALDFASAVLRNFGPEGDLGGPLEEVRLLAELLRR